MNAYTKHEQAMQKYDLHGHSPNNEGLIELIPETMSWLAIRVHLLDTFGNAQPYAQPTKGDAYISVLCGIGFATDPSSENKRTMGKYRRLVHLTHLLVSHSPHCLFWVAYRVTITLG